MKRVIEGALKKKIFVYYPIHCSERQRKVYRYPRDIDKAIV